MILDHAPPPITPAAYVFRNPEVLRVIDGDSLIMRFPLPFNEWRDLDIRLLGINSPEKVGTARAAGEAARLHLLSLLDHAEEVRAQTYKTDKFGRYLGELWIRHGSVWTNVSAALIDAGHGVPYDGGPR